MTHTAKIKMTKDAHGCEDGFTSRHYKKGEVYDVKIKLAKNFIIAKVAEHHVEEKAKQPHDNKSLTGGDYQNKSDKRDRRDK